MPKKPSKCSPELFSSYFVSAPSDDIAQIFKKNEGSKFGALSLESYSFTDKEYACLMGHMFDLADSSALVDCVKKFTLSREVEVSLRSMVEVSPEYVVEALHDELKSKLRFFKETAELQKLKKTLEMAVRQVHFLYKGQVNHRLLFGKDTAYDNVIDFKDDASLVFHKDDYDPNDSSVPKRPRVVLPIYGHGTMWTEQQNVSWSGAGSLFRLNAGADYYEIPKGHMAVLRTGDWGLLHAAPPATKRIVYLAEPV